jgi:plasmid stabilization system protein ParE
MAGKPKISFAESAVHDLEEIRAWYTRQQAPEAGEHLIREAFSQIERLLDFPQSGRVVPEFDLVNLREIIYPPFRIVYRLDGKRVRIVRVWRSERVLKIIE